MYQLTNIDNYHFRPAAASSDPDVYVLDVRRTPAGLACITSSQRLSLHDPAALSRGPLSNFPTDHGNVTGLRLFGDGGAAAASEGGSLVCTTGENGRVAVWDLRLGSREACVAQFEASETPILSMACSSSTQTIAVGTELQNHTASIFLWDVRSTPSPKASYHEVHSDDVTDLTFHPSNPALLMSGSTDGLVNVCDTRIPDEDDLVVQTLNHNASIHRAAFLNDTEVLALSHDERFALYDLDEARENGDAAQDFGDLRPGLGCQYVADVVPKADGSGSVVGAGSQDRQAFELVFMAKSGQQWALDADNKVGLPGAHGEEIVRAFCFYDEEQAVFTAGEDGKIKAWRPGN